MRCKDCTTPLAYSGRGRPPLYCQGCRGARRRRDSVRSSATLRAQHAALITAAKSKPCVDCQVQYPPAAMDLDHVRGTKCFPLSHVRNGKVRLPEGFGSLVEAIHAEIAKCDVRCAVCHRLRHAHEREA